MATLVAILAVAALPNAIALAAEESIAAVLPIAIEFPAGATV